MGLSLQENLSCINLSPYPRPEPFSHEKKEEACDELLRFLLRERGMIAAFSATYEKKRSLVRDYMNVRPPLPIPDEILRLQDRLFYTETLERGVISPEDIPAGKYNLALWQGDITRLAADGIVNAANKGLLGCFAAGHHCIDNAIHSFAGMQVRDDCAKLIAAQGGEEECGMAKVTRAYNLPSRYILHTVGPMVGRSVTDSDRAALRSCYNSCLNVAGEMDMKSVAFCCVATGLFNFPHEEAAEIATGAAINWKLKHPDSDMKIIFNTFLPFDTEIYANILRGI